MAGGGGRAVRVGILHPGEMGAALGAVLVGIGHDVVWASEGRSAATAGRAADAGLRDVVWLDALAATSDLVVSVCPPDRAGALAGALPAFGGIYLDANAVAPETAVAIGAGIAAGGGRFVDGAVVGPPPVAAGTTRLYLSGPDALEVSEAWASPLLEVAVISSWPGSASALKAAYAAWTKGSAALLLASIDAARAEGVEGWLRDEWARSRPELADLALRATRQAEAKGWRWSGEMAEGARFLESHGLPGGFHRAAAEIYDRYPRPGDDGRPA